MESILTSVKKMLGIAEEYTHFDADIIMHTNSVFMILHQLGVGPDEGFYIEDETAAWADFLGDPTILQMVKSYMYMKVRLLFDPPANGTVMKAIEQSISEAEFRLNIAVDNGGITSSSGAKDHIILKDQYTAEEYRLYVSNSDLRMDTSEG